MTTDVESHVRTNMPARSRGMGARASNRPLIPRNAPIGGEI
jgi:hypothetical protein